MCTCVCRVGTPLEHKDRHRWGRGPGRPACIGGKSGSSSVWQPMDLTELDAAAPGAGPCTPTPRSPIPVLWTPEGPQGIAGGPGVEGVGGLGGGGELLAEEASLRCWSRGLGGGGGEGRTEKVLRRGIGEPGGKTTWEREKRDRDEDDDGGGDSSLGGGGSRGLSLLASGVRPASRGHRTPPAPRHPPRRLPSGQGWGRTGGPLCPGPARGHLLTTFSTSCPPARLPRGCTVMTTPSVSQSSAEAPVAPAVSSASGRMPSRPCSSAMSRSWDGVLLRVAGSSRRRGEGSRDMG